VSSTRDERLFVVASKTAAFWAFGYALYRLYYAAGGTLGMFGTPVSYAQFRSINAIAAVALVGCIMHGDNALLRIDASRAIAFAHLGQHDSALDLTALFPNAARTIDIPSVANDVVPAYL
jgi:hypothetical protein